VEGIMTPKAAQKRRENAVNAKEVTRHSGVTAPARRAESQRLKEPKSQIATTFVEEEY